MTSDPSALRIAVLTTENARLRRLLRQAGLDPEAGLEAASEACGCGQDAGQDEPSAAWCL